MKEIEQPAEAIMSFINIHMVDTNLPEDMLLESIRYIVEQYGNKRYNEALDNAADEAEVIGMDELGIYATKPQTILNIKIPE